MLTYKNRQTLLTARTGKLAESLTYKEIPIHPHIQPMPEERARDIRALQQLQQLTEQQVEELLEACIDTRPLPISIQQELRVGTVQEMAWKSLRQPFILDHEAQSTALKALDSSMASICEGAAMLLQHSKTLAQDIQQSATQKIWQLLLDGNSQHRFPTSGYFELPRLYDTLFQTLRVLTGYS